MASLFCTMVQAVALQALCALSGRCLVQLSDAKMHFKRANPPICSPILILFSRLKGTPKMARVM